MLGHNQRSVHWLSIVGGSTVGCTWPVLWQGGVPGGGDGGGSVQPLLDRIGSDRIEGS